MEDKNKPTEHYKDNNDEVYLLYAIFINESLVGA